MQSFEIDIYQGKTDIFWRVTDNKGLNENAEFDAEKEFCNRFKTEIDSLESLAQNVAALYNVGRNCLCCGRFCNDKYCSLTCKNAIPCDLCARNRLPRDFDLAALSKLPNDNDDNDTLQCDFCKNAIDFPKFSFDALVYLIFDTLPTIVAKSSGDIYQCCDCGCFFMHDPDYECKDGKEKKEKCYLCAPHCGSMNK